MLQRSTAGYWMARFLVGIALVAAAGLGVFRRLLHGSDPMGLGTFLPGFTGFYLALSSITPLVRFATLESRTRREWSHGIAEQFARASLPRRIWYLLASVAEADGPMSNVERETVRRFLLERFVDPIDTDELSTWEAQPLPIADRIGLAARIAMALDDGERDSLFCWCCFVAFADGGYREHEHEVLQQVRKGLGLPPERARMLFHLARAQWLRGQKTGDASRTGPALDARGKALAVLGLPADATADAIRKRHRQLVRQFHPDAQPRLGQVAQREATERFQEIQRAYETLGG